MINMDTTCNGSNTNPAGASTQHPENLGSVLHTNNRLAVSNEQAAEELYFIILQRLKGDSPSVHVDDHADFGSGLHAVASDTTELEQSTAKILERITNMVQDLL